MDNREHITSQAQLAKICRQTLADWPEAQAAVLFGSRARGSHHPDSDWDIAVILDGNAPVQSASELPQGNRLHQIDNLDAWAVGSETVIVQAGHLGRISCAIMLDGKLLSGEWHRPPAKKLSLEPEDWLDRMNSVLNLVEDSIDQYRKMARRKTWTRCASRCRVFVRTGSDAAERLVKAMMERRGVRADTSHDMNILSRSFADARPEERELAQRMKELNGKSRKDHQADYPENPLTPDDCSRAVSRLAGTLELLAHEVEDAVNSDFEKAASLIAEEIADDLEYWKGLVDSPMAPKPDENSLAYLATQALLDGRETVRVAIDDLEERLSQLRAGII